MVRPFWSKREMVFLLAFKYLEADISHVAEKW